MGGTTLLSSLDMERLARHGLLEYGEFEEKSGVYVYKISLSDATESSDEETANEEKKVMKNFIVKLEDNNDFKMAFNVD